MRAPRLTALALVLAVPALVASPAAANDSVGLGVGVESSLAVPDGLGAVSNGAAVTYQAGQFHVQGMLGFHDNGSTVVNLGGRFMWHMHSTATSDFSLGGGLGIINVDNAGPGDDGSTFIALELGGQIRAFVTPNVSLNAMLGIAYLMVDEEAGDDLLGLTGNLVGGFGATYFFF